MSWVTIIMPSTIFRTASSSVVLLADNKCLEVRKGDLKGAAITDRRTWDSKDAWLSDLGEAEIPETPLSEDMKLMASLTRIYGAGKMMIRNKSYEMEGLLSDMENAKFARDYLGSRKPNAEGLYKVHPELLDAEGRPSLKWCSYPSTNSVKAVEMKELRGRLAKYIGRGETRYNCLEAQRLAYLKSGRLNSELAPYGTSALYVSCDDNVIRSVYYNASHMVCGVHVTDKEFRVGTRFAELGICPIGWFVKNRVTGSLTQITL